MTKNYRKLVRLYPFLSAQLAIAIALAGSERTQGVLHCEVISFVIAMVVWVVATVLMEVLRPKQTFDPPPVSGLEDFNVPTAQEGRPIPAIYGTVMIRSPNVVEFAAVGTTANEHTVKNGLWSTTWVTTGYNYFVDVVMVVCAGPATAVKQIFFGDLRVWKGVAMNKTITFNKPNLWGGEEKGGGLTGPLRVENGSDLQYYNDYFLDKIAAEVAVSGYQQDFQDSLADGDLWEAIEAFRNINEARGRQVWSTYNYSPTYHHRRPVYRGVTTLHLQTLNIGTSAYIRPIKIVLEKVPEGFGSGNYSPIPHHPERLTHPNDWDANPVEILYDLMTNTDYGMGKEGYLFDIESWAATAAQLYSENFGMSYVVAQHSSFETVINDILRHIDGVMYPSAQTGKFTLRLLRDDYDINDLRFFDESNVIEVLSFTRGSWDETFNEVKVNYISRENDYETGTVVAQNLANRYMQTEVVSLTRTYNGIYTGRLAERIAERDLRASSYPRAHVELRVNRQGFDLAPGDVIAWQYDPLGIVKMILRVQKVDYGNTTKPEIVVTCTEDAFALGDSVYGDPPAAVGTADQVAQQEAEQAEADFVRAAEAPLVLTQGDPDISTASYDGKYWVVASDSGTVSTAYDVYSRISPDVFTKWEYNFRYVPHAKVVYPVTPYANSLLLGPVNGGTPFPTVDPARVSENLALIGNELFAYEVATLDTVTGNTLLHGEFWRGIGDTVPMNHPTNADVFFIGQYVPSTVNTYTEGDSVELKVAPQNRYQTSEVDGITGSVTVDFGARVFRPIAPGCVKVNGVEFNLQYLDTPDVTLSWAHRDRFSGPRFIDNSDPTDYGPEAGTTYTVKVFNAEGVLIHTASAIATNTFVYSQAQEQADDGKINEKLTFQVSSQRDSYDSWQVQTRTIYRTVGNVFGFGSDFGTAFGAGGYQAGTNPGTVPGVVEDANLSDTQVAQPLQASVAVDPTEPTDNATTGLGFDLAVDQYVPTRIPATIVSPAAALTPASRYLYTHTNLPYEVPLIVMGGAPPFHFVIGGTLSATIEPQAPAFNPNAYSWAKITAPAGVGGTITVEVYDQDNRSSPVASVAWLVNHDDSKFTFVDKLNGSISNIGTYESPYGEIYHYRNKESAGPIIVYESGSYAPDATSGNDMVIFPTDPVAHVGRPGSAVVWDFDTNGIDGAVAAELVDWYMSGITLRNGTEQFVMSGASLRSTWWQVVSESPTAGGIVYEGSGSHNAVAIADITLRDYPASPPKAVGYHGGITLNYMGSFAADGVVAENFLADTVLQVAAQTYSGTITGLDVWTDSSPGVGALYTPAPWYGESMVGFTDPSLRLGSALQVRYSRGHQLTDDPNDMALGVPEAYKMSGYRWLDRCTSVGGTAPVPDTVEAMVTRCIIANDLTPIIDDTLTVDFATLQYTRAELINNSDLQGALQSNDDDLYKVGYLVAEALPAAPEAGDLLTGVTQLDKIFFSATHDPTCDWAAQDDYTRLSDATLLTDSSSEFTPQIAPYGGSEHVLRDYFEEYQYEYGGYVDRSPIRWVTGQMRKGSEVWIRQAIYLPDGTEGMTMPNGSAAPAFRTKPHDVDGTFIEALAASDGEIPLETLIYWSGSDRTTLQGELVLALEEVVTPGTEPVGLDDEGTPDTVEGYLLNLNLEGGEQGWQYDLTGGMYLHPGQWHVYELYVKFDDQTAGEGGSPSVRLWIDGSLRCNRDDIRTMVNATDQYEGRRFLPYWPGHCPQNQMLFYSSLAVAIEGQNHSDLTHLSADASDNPFIGLLTAPTLTGSYPAPVPGVGNTNFDAITFFEGFEAGSEGTAVSAVTVLEDASAGEITLLKQFSLTRSMKTTVQSGTSGVASFGFTLNTLPKMLKSSEVWFRFSVNLPDSFDFTASPALGLGYFNIVSSTGISVGAVESYLTASGEVGFKSAPGLSTPELSGTTIPTDQWVVIEQYVKLDDVSARVKIWVDGTEVLDSTSHLTLSSASDYLGSISLLKIWDGDAPSTQSVWIDEVAVAVKGPMLGGGFRDETAWMMVDGLGQPFIGAKNVTTDPTAEELVLAQESGITDLSAIAYFQNFETIAHSAAVQDSTLLTACSNGTVDISTAYPLAGTRSMRSWIAADVAGRQEFGFDLPLASALSEGDELWVRLAVRYPAGFDFTNPGYSALKLLSFIRSAAKGNRRRGDVHVGIKPDQSLTTFNDLENVVSGDMDLAGSSLPTDSWALVEVYINFSALAADNGGTGAIKVWVDGSPVGEAVRETLQDSADLVTAVSWHQQWDGTAPALQDCWVDQIAYAVRTGTVDDTTNMATDTNGFPFIGSAAQ